MACSLCLEATVDLDLQQHFKKSSIVGDYIVRILLTLQGFPCSLASSL